MASICQTVPSFMTGHYVHRKLYKHLSSLSIKNLARAVPSHRASPSLWSGIPRYQGCFPRVQNHSSSRHQSCALSVPIFPHSWREYLRCSWIADQSCIHAHHTHFQRLCDTINPLQILAEEISSQPNFSLVRHVYDVFLCLEGE